MDYSDKSVQQTLEKMLSELEGHPNVYPKQGTQSWLRDFLDYAKSLEGDPVSALDITNEESFVKALTLVSKRFSFSILFSIDFFRHIFCFSIQMVLTIELLKMFTSKTTQLLPLVS